MKNLFLASKNKGKIEEYKKLLAGVNCKLLLQPESLEVEEDGLTFRDNAIKKASEVSRKTNNFSIADDSGICIEALGGKPGIYSSRYAENDQKRIERVLRELDGVQNRSAFFIANICVCSPNGEVIIESEAKCHILSTSIFIGSVTSCLISSKLGSLNKNCIFFFVPVKKLSRHITSSPFFSKVLARCEPRNPLPPVIKFLFFLCIKKVYDKHFFILSYY